MYSQSQYSSGGSTKSPCMPPRQRYRRAPPPMPLTVRRRKKQHPQEAIDEFWTKFSTKNPGKATTVIPHNKYAARAAAKAGWSIGITTQASYEEAAMLCRAKVKKIANECERVNSKYNDPHFDLEFDLKFGNRDSLDSLQNTAKSITIPSISNNDQCTFQPRGVKRVPDIFDDPQFYIDGPTANDVRQGHVGDCWLMAALCTMSNKPGLIEKICVAQQPNVGVYGFVFHRDGEWFSEIIDDKLYLSRPDYDDQGIERIIWNDRDREDPEEAYRRTYQMGSGALYFAQCEHPNETWLPLLEKAYAKAHGDYSAIEGGFIGEGIEDLCGGVTTEVYTTDILDREKFWQELLRVNKEFLFGCSTGLRGNATGESQGIIELHSYSVMKAIEVDGKRLCLLKNPWGKGEWQGPWSDGSKEWTPEWMKKLNHRFGNDGSFYIQYSDLLRKYQAFDRTRLFGPEWKVASIWTTLNIPWTHDYHDTHFSFVLRQSGPVVVALSQLDDRYFRGLQGQYTFELSFRIHKAGHKDYVVRSQIGYRLRRSVSVELNLEAGEYIVLVKIDANRNEYLSSVEDVVRTYAKERREKLTRIGLSYDLAHSKGRIVETEDEREVREKWEKKNMMRAKKQLRDKMLQEKRKKYTIAMLDYKRQLRKHHRRQEKEKELKSKEKKEKDEKDEKEETDEKKEKDERDEKEETDEKKEIDEKNEKDEKKGIEKQVLLEKDCDDGISNDILSSKRADICEHENVHLSQDNQTMEPLLRKSQKSEPQPKAKDDSQLQSQIHQHRPLYAPSSNITMPHAHLDERSQVSSHSRRFDRLDQLREREKSPLDGERCPIPAIVGESPNPPSSVSSIDDEILEFHLDGTPILDRPFLPSRLENYSEAPVFYRNDQNKINEQENYDIHEDPWNAVAVVGLRVFYDTKGMEKPSPMQSESKTGDLKKENENIEIAEEEFIKLCVVRPNIYEESSDEEEVTQIRDEKRHEDGDEEENKNKANTHTSTNRKQKDEILAQGLDVDDSAKDATLKGDTETKKRGIIADLKRANTII